MILNLQIAKSISKKNKWNNFRNVKRNYKMTLNLYIKMSLKVKKTIEPIINIRQIKNKII